MTKNRAIIKLESAIDRIIDFQEYDGTKKYNYDLQIILDKLNHMLTQLTSLNEE